MAKAKKVAPKRRPNRTAEVMVRVEAFLDKIAPDVVKRLASAEARANHAETELQWLRSRLVGLLSPNQIEAAKICSMAPEHYAIEHIQLWKERIFAGVPVGILPLSTLKAGYSR